MYADDTTLLSTYDTFHTNTDTDIATIQRNINKELLRVTSNSHVDIVEYFKSQQLQALARRHSMQNHSKK